MIERARQWLIDTLPDGLLFRPFESFGGILAFLVGVTITFSSIESRSVEAQLPWPVYKVWGILLATGGIALFTSVLSIKQVGLDRYVVKGQALQKLGLRLLGLSCVIYIGCLLVFNRGDGVVPSLFPAAFACACGLKLLWLAALASGAQRREERENDSSSDG